MLQYTFLVRVIKVELRELFGSKTHEYPVSIGAELSTIKLPSRREGVGSELCRRRQVVMLCFCCRSRTSRKKTGGLERDMN